MNERQDLYKTNEVIGSRTKKNQGLYRSMSEEELDNFDVDSNSTVLSNGKQTIDIDELRSMLDKKYRTPKRAPLLQEEPNIDKGIHLDETREYDINELIKQAKEENESTYEEDRLKKLKDTNINILNEIALERQEMKARNEKESHKLMELIDTINLKEAEGYEKLLEEEKNAQTVADIDPLDMFSSLKGDEDTRVLGAKENTKEAPMIKGIYATSSYQTKELQQTSEQKLSNTNTNTFTQSDFDDFHELKEEVSSNKAIIKFLVVIIVLALIAVGVFVANEVLNLGLFS